MDKNTIFDMENGESFFVADETVQNGVKYYLVNRVGENEEPLPDSLILMETKKGNNVYFDIVKDESTLNYLGAIFLANFSNYLDEEEA